MPKFERLKGRWKKLAYWQKGAIIGGGLHIGIVLLIILAAFLFVPRTTPPGSGDMGPASAWILYALYSLIELIPNWVAYLLTGVKDLGEPRPKIWIWFLFVVYTTLFYSLVGIVIAEVIRRLRKQNG